MAGRVHRLERSPAPVAGGAGSCLDAVLEINVGGRVFVTRRSTLAAVRGSRLAHLFGENSPGFLTASRDQNGRVFLDRDADTFAHVLDYLRRAGQLVGEFSRDALARLREDAQHFGLPGLVAEVDTAEQQMRRREVYEYQHLMYGPLLVLEGTPFDTQEKVASERAKRDTALVERSNEGWRIDKLTVDTHGVWLDLFLARPTGRWFQPKDSALLYGGGGWKIAQSTTLSSATECSEKRRRPKVEQDPTPKKRRSAAVRDAASIAAAATLAEREAKAIALASATARAARGPLPTTFELNALRPEVVYDLITDENPCQGRRPERITDSDVGKIYVERVNGVPGQVRKDRRPAGLQKWSQGDTLWIKPVPKIRYGPEGKGQVWVKALYGQVLPASTRPWSPDRSKAAALAQASAAATASPAAALEPTFSYHMYEVHWFNEGFEFDRQCRPSFQCAEKADWCAVPTAARCSVVCCLAPQLVGARNCSFVR